MARDSNDTTPLTTRAELIEWFAAGEKPRARFAIGTEHEKIPFYRESRAPVPYDGDRGIRALLEGLAGETGWEPIVDLGNIIGLSAEAGGAISIEPGGQFELSGAALPDVHATAAELATHLAATKRVADPLGIGFLTLGMSPKWRRDETPVMPKSRYRIMAGYMPKVGSLGLDMMLRTATVQVNLDFASEGDMVRKMRASLALQPVATALFANSPFTDGRPNGFLSRRSEIWRDTDADRTGMLPFAFDAGFGYEAYVDWLLDMPMYFVKRGDTYHDVSGASFRDLMAGKLPQLPGEFATVSDWANHASTAFPEVRLKRFPGDARRRCRRFRHDRRPGRFLGGPPLRRGGPRRGPRPREGVEPGQSRGCAGHRTAPRARDSGGQHHPRRGRRRGPGDRPVGSAGTGPPRRRGAGRDHLPAASRGHRRGRPDAGRGSARRLRGPLGRLRAAGLRRMRLLTPP